MTTFYIFSEKCLKFFFYFLTMEIKETIKLKKTSYKYLCEVCDFKCSQKIDWDRHIVRPKHQKNVNGNVKETKVHIKKALKFFCKCEKEFQTNAGLWKHKQKCNFIDVVKDKDNEYMYQGINIKDKDALVLHLLQQNGELQNKIIDMASQSSITNNNNNNSHNTTNNAFNLNLFLNETCKNAMNITDFVSSIKMNLDDLENTGRFGYIEGISNIILKNLNKLEQHMRPLHCSDFKREVLYIKDNNKWEKETEDKPILTNAIKTIANKNIKQISTWRDSHLDCTNADSKKNNLYLKIVSNSMNDTTEEDGKKNMRKIISNVVKEVIIEK